MTEAVRASGRSEGTSEALQDRYAPNNNCFGCGPANEKGLRIKSVVSADGSEVVADWTPEAHHEAFPGVMNGGIVGALLDCHSNWAACHHLMVKSGATTPPCTVTADYHVKMRRPTPMGPVRIVAKVVESTDDKVVVEASLQVGGQGGGKETATCRGTFVAVKEGHPAFHRW